MKQLIAAVLMGLLAGQLWAAAEEVVVYSARKEHLIKPLFDAYTQKTGVPIRYITDKAGPLLQRLKAEGTNTRADVLMTVDAGNLWQAANEGVLSAVRSQVLEQNIPAHLRDPDGRWFGLSVRARTIAYSTERVKPGAPDAVGNLTELLTAAKAHGRNVNVFLQGNEIERALML